MQCSGQAALTEASDCGSIFVSQVNVNASSDCKFIDCDSSVYKGLEIPSKFKPKTTEISKSDNFRHFCGKIR